MKGNTSFYSDAELAELGLGSYGENVLISRKCSIYSPEKIHIGNNVRIDDFCILSGRIRLGNYVHIAAYCAIYGGNTGVLFENYTGLSARGVIYAESDDYSGGYYTNPLVALSYRNIIKGPVVIREHSIIGAGTIILPNCILEVGAAVGAMSLVTKSLDPWSIYVGIPAKKIRDRQPMKFEL